MTSPRQKLAIILQYKVSVLSIKYAAQLIPTGLLLISVLVMASLGKVRDVGFLANFRLA